MSDEYGRRRRARDGILEAIAACDDSQMKTVLLLLLQVVEEIGEKIEGIRSDERALRESVLNGFEPVHHDHHEWIAAKMSAENDAEQEAKANRRAATDAAIKQVVTILVSATAGLVGALLMLKG